MFYGCSKTVFVNRLFVSALLTFFFRLPNNSTPSQAPHQRDPLRRCDPESAAPFSKCRLVHRFQHRAPSKELGQGRGGCRGILVVAQLRDARLRQTLNLVAV